MRPSPPSERSSLSWNSLQLCTLTVAMHPLARQGCTAPFFRWKTLSCSRFAAVLSFVCHRRLLMDLRE